MSAHSGSGGRSYDSLYHEFDSPLRRQLRLEAYGEDIGQHSWVLAEELKALIPLLRLSPTSRLLDVGCGPAGPLTFVTAQVGCHGVGVDLSEEAVAAGRDRAVALGLDGLVSLQQADSNEPIPFPNRSFDAVMSLDVVLHLRDRSDLFREVARVLVSGGRFWFTDSAVMTGPASSDEIALRSFHGKWHLVPTGFNERALEEAGLKLLQVDDRTASLVKNATGRIAARLAHRTEVRQVEGREAFEGQQLYLETVVTLAQRGALSRFSYVAESV